MHINPGTERAILRLSDNMPGLISALQELREVFDKVEPYLKLFGEVMTAAEVDADSPYTSERMKKYYKGVIDRERKLSDDDK